MKKLYNTVKWKLEIKDRKVTFQNLTKTSTVIQNEYASDIPYEVRLCNGSSITNRVQRGQLFKFQ